MKQLFIIAAIFLASCSKDNPQPNEPIKDCDCDRAMEHTKFYMVGNSQTGTSGYYFGTYVLINDCTGVQYNGNWNTSNGDSEPINGECYTK